VEEVEIVAENHLIVDGKLSLNQLSRYVPLEVDDEEWDTVGGWLYAQRDTLHRNQYFDYEGYRFTVLERAKTRYLRIEIKALAQELQAQHDGESQD
jgi:CBS domain containing-hemolysin-like protein